MKLKCITPVAGVSILTLIAATTAYAEGPLLDESSKSSGEACDLAKGQDPEEFFRKHSWILPVEKPTNPKSFLSSSKFKNSSLHFDCQPNTPVRAIATGKVLFAGWYGGYGKVIIVSHDEGLLALYAHLSETLAAKDETVFQGQTIAKSGSTGFSSKPGSLHFEIRKGGKPLDWSQPPTSPTL